MTDLYFAEPQWLHLLWVVLAFMLLLVWLERRGSGALSRFMQSTLQLRLVRSASTARRVFRLIFLSLFGIFLTLALMQPQVGLQLVSTPRVGAEIMVCLDVSKSMLAEDVAPNRLERAKAELKDLLAYLDGDQVGLIAFAGRATVLSPLTPDFGFLRLVLDEAGAHSVTRGGTRLEEPIRKAVAGFGDSGEVARVILLITDGEDHDSFPLEAAKAAAERGIRILSIGFGDETGSEIMLTDPASGARTVLRDGDGNSVRSRLDGDLLREMALLTEGAYVPAGTGVLDLESIYQRHIEGLMRASLEGGSRTIRNDAFQWPILLALLCLLAAVASTASTTPPSSRRQDSLSQWAGLLLFFGLLLNHLSIPVAEAQQQTATEPAKTQAAEAVQNNDNSTENTVEIESKTESKTTTQKALPEDPRELYNLALTRLSADDFEQADELLMTARGKSGADGEVRFRATYNLAWVEVKRADASLEKEPEAALQSLQRSADWFREAISLRPGDDDSRHNLEIVLRRAMALADSLAQRDERDLLTQLNELIETQRSYLGELRNGVDLLAARDDPNAVQTARRAYRDLSVAQLDILGQAESFNTRAGNELDTLKGKTEEELTPEDRIRIAQIEGLLQYLHQARERLGQARSQLRRLQAERAYRRAAAGLTELKRARDQLLDPVARLDGLLADGLELAQLTSIKASLERGAGIAPDASHTEEIKAPSWLNNDYLLETQQHLELRTDELQRGLAAGIAQQDDASGEQAQLDEEQRRLLIQLRAAEPLIGVARDEFQNASTALNDGNTTDAVEPQGKALAKLTDARELFLDLRRLIELVYQDERQIDSYLTEDKERKATEIVEYAPLAGEIQGKNRKRASRVGTMIADALMEAVTAEEQAKAAAEADPANASNNPNNNQDKIDPAAAAAEKQRMELADQLQLKVQQSMQTAEADLNKLAESSEPNANDANLQQARGSVTTALSNIEELRRLFFSVIEHLKETARHQIELGDETEEIAALADADDDDENAAKNATQIGAISTTPARASGYLYSYQRSVE